MSMTFILVIHRLLLFMLTLILTLPNISLILISRMEPLLEGLGRTRSWTTTRCSRLGSGGMLKCS